jgi:putative transposase
MGRPYSRDLRERVVAAVEQDSLSRRKAATQFAVGISTVINWVRRCRETGTILPGKMGGHRPKAIAGEHRTWLLFRIKERDFTLRGRVAELSERGLKVDYKTVWNFIHAEKLSFKKNRAREPSKIARTSREGVSSGKNTRPGSPLSAWFSSTRPGAKPIWRRAGAGRCGVRGSRPRFRTATGKP